MKRRSVTFTWENPDAQECFAEWCPFPDARASAEDVARIELLTGIAPPMRVLDVGCGNGRHAIQFALRGYSVVGIDVAERFLSEARRSAADARVDVEFRLQRASQLTDTGEFGFALAYWHTIGFMSDDEIREHFRAVRIALKENGIFLYVFQGPKILPIYTEATPKWIRDWREKDGKFILSRKTLEGGYREEYCVVIDTIAEEITEYTERQRAFRLSDVMTFLEGAGFSDVMVYRDLEMNPADAKDFSIFVCRKSAD